MFIFENRFNSKWWTFILSLALDTSLWLIDNYYCKIYAFNSIISSGPAWKDSSKGVLENSQLDTSSSTWAWWNGDVAGIPLLQTNKYTWFLSAFVIVIQWKRSWCDSCLHLYIHGHFWINLCVVIMKEDIKLSSLHWIGDVYWKVVERGRGVPLVVVIVSGGDLG